MAVGGDGTVRTVAAALAGSSTLLGVVPAGSGNDLARTFGIPEGLAEAAEVALRGTPKQVDAGSRGGELFFNVAGIGFDAEVARRFNSSPPWALRLGVRLRYYLAVVGAFARYPHPAATLLLDGDRVECQGLLLAAVGNCRYYGGGLAVCPEADPSDGLFDVVWGTGLRLGEILRLMSAMPKGGHLASPKVFSRRCARVRVESATPVPCHLDGDLASDTPFEAEAVPACLWLSVPGGPQARVPGLVAGKAASQSGTSSGA